MTMAMRTTATTSELNRMLLRIRSPDGTARITVEPSTTGEDFAQMMLATLSSPPDMSTIMLSNQPAGGERLPLTALQGRKVDDMGFSHGDLLFLDYKPVQEEKSQPVASSSTLPTQSAKQEVAPAVQEAPVDEYWRTQDGKIHRKRDPTFCRHGDKGMCDYCMPLEPFDAGYQARNQIKHLSFHSHLRKLLSSLPPSAQSSTPLPPLTPLSLSVIKPCPSGTHPPFPAGICSHCQPSALTLHSQPFRMVDHVEFASPDLIDGLLSAWRRTGLQRIGYLLGRYDRYEKVPMGVKAVVESIFEPMQEGEVDGLTVETPWSDEERVKQVAGWCGLTVVGVIYTDLSPVPDDITKTLYKRHPQSYHASSLELLTSAAQQVAHPFVTRASSTGAFSSRFVTCCLTGTAEGGIDVLAWQASEQAEAMVKANIVEASVDPGTVRVRKPDPGQYIPEVFYSYKNEYGIQVKNPAKPTFPVEYLLVNVTHGFPNDPSPLFLSNTFPIENRPGLHNQDMSVVVQQLSALIRGASPHESIQRWLSDWHLVWFLCREGGFSEDEQRLICRVASEHAGVDDLMATSGWQNLTAIVESSAVQDEQPGSSGDFGSAPAPLVEAGPRVCPHCTFLNEGSGSDCEVCGLPL